MRKHLTACFSLLSLLLSAQSVFVKTYDEGKKNQGMSATILFPNGNISLGGGTDDRAAVALFNPQGEQIWAKKFTFGAYETAITGLAKASDGNLVAAYTAYISPTQAFSGLIKMDVSNGSILWSQKLLNDTIVPFFQEVYANDQGSFVTGYTTIAVGLGRSYGLMAQLDENGALIWANSQTIHSFNFASCADAVGNLYTVGSYLTSWEAPFAKYAPDGKVLWNKHLELGTFDQPLFKNILALPNQSFLLGGWWNTPAQKRALLTSVDADANINWAKAYALSGQALQVLDTQMLPDGNIVAICHGAELNTLGKEKSILLKISPDDGEVIWAKQYDNFGKDDYLDEITAHPTSGFVITGRARIKNGTNSLLLLHTDSEFGVGSCCPREVEVTATAIFPFFTSQVIANPRSYKTAPVSFTVADVVLAPTLQCAPLRLDFTFADSVLCPGQCTVITLDTVAADVKYTFGLDGGTADPSVPNGACFPGSRIYAVTLKAEKEGCQEVQNTENLLVRSIADQFPNAFTPNGDAVNDVFRSLYFCPAVLADFRVYDRWGRLVFQTTDPEQGWDGTFEGKPAPADVYAWRVEYEAVREEGGGRFSEKGNVTLLR